MRLRPLTISLPKPMLPLGDRPILDVVLSQLASAGCRRVVVCAGYLGSVISSFVGDGARWGMDVEILAEDEPQGTAGGLRGLGAVDQEFIVINGDTLTDLDFVAMRSFHRDRDAAMTLFTPWIEDQLSYGVVTVEPSTGELQRYDEKPRRGYFVSSGVYVLSPEVLALIPESGRFDMPDLVRRVIDADQRVVAFQDAAYWRDIGLIDHYELACSDFVLEPSRFLK
jgi:NDP-sugar pyrophosphorylase family protein